MTQMAFLSLLYVSFILSVLYLAWKAVQAFTRIAASLEDIAATYRRREGAEASASEPIPE